MNHDIVKNHRTILFVDARDPDATFQERANRLIESLNGNQIKVDVHAVTVATKVSVEPIDRVGLPTFDDGYGNDFDVDELRRLARDYGYDQMLISVKP